MRGLVFILIFLCTAAVISGCDDDALDEKEVAEIHTIFKTGIEHEDPFVRAETLRVLSMLDDPGLAAMVTPLARDESPMVRVLALRVLLGFHHSEARSLVLARFSKADDEERRALLNAALELGPPPLQRELTGRAMRSSDPALRQLAFEQGTLTRVDDAIAAKNTSYLEHTLFPELGRYITERDDPLLAALALEKLIEAGQSDRAQPLIDKVASRRAKLEDRLVAADILMRAHVPQARETFVDIIERYEEVMADRRLGVPDKVVDPKLLRAAVLGAVAAGDETYVEKALEYRNNADVEATNEVLEAISRNRSTDAAIALKVAMQDARRPVRRRAIEFYQVREDADPAALNDAMKGAQFETRRRLSAILLERFSDAWLKMLAQQLERPTEVNRTLELLRDVIESPAEAEKLIEPLREPLTKLSDADDKKRAALASYLLALVSDDEQAQKLVDEKLDEATRYAYLQFLLTTDPAKHVDTFRRHFHHDMYVIRLMSSVGLWKAYGMKMPASTAAAPDAGEASE